MRRAFRLLSVLLTAWVPFLAFRRVVPRAASLHALADSGNPYFVPEHAFLLYVLSPLVVVSACVLLLTPGLLVALALDRARSPSEWVLFGFAAAIVLVGVVTTAVQAVVPLDTAGFVIVVAACTLLGFGALLLRVRRAQPAWPLDAPYVYSTLLGMVLVPAALLAVLTPKFYWESFNGDGAHAYEAARLLLHQAVPFWPSGSGEIGGFPGLTSALYAYPASWFIRLFGPLEVSARLPYLLYLAALHGASIPLIEEGRRWVAKQAERLVLWLSFTVYTLTVAFSATYSPYSADIALPATQDTLLVVCFLGFALSCMRRDWGWFALFALLTFTALPNGLLMIVFWALAMALTLRHGRFELSGLAVVGCLIFAIVTPRLLSIAGLPAPGGEYGGGGFLVRFAFLQLTDWSRFAYILVPSGILPALSLLLLPKMEDSARAFALVAIASFLFAYVQAHAPLHYYIPAMLLPLIVFWRVVPTDRRRTIAVVAIIATTLTAFWLALPARPVPFTATRAVGETIEIRGGDYQRMSPDAFRGSTLLHRLIPYDWDPVVPEASFGGSPLAFHYYARLPKPPGLTVNYVLQPSADPRPAGMRPVVADSEFTAYVRSDAVWASHLALRPPTPAGSPLLAVPRGVLFRTEPLPTGFRLIDLPAIARRLGIDVDALAERLGVGR